MTQTNQGVRYILKHGEDSQQMQNLWRYSHKTNYWTTYQDEELVREALTRPEAKLKDLQEFQASTCYVVHRSTLSPP